MRNSITKKEQIRSLKYVKSIQQLLNSAYKIFGHPILLHDMDYKVIALTEGIVTDDPIWNEYEKKGTVGMEQLEFFKNECFFEMAANAQKITFLISDKLKYDRIFGKLFTIDQLEVGCAVMVACFKPFGEDDPSLFDELCEVITAKLCRDKFFQNYGQASIGGLINQIIGNEIEDVHLYTAHVENIYMGLKTNLFVGVADISGSKNPDPVYFRDLFRHTRTDYKYSIYSGYVIIIMSSDSSTPDIEKSIPKLCKIFKKNNIFLGVSGRFENIFELPKRYNEALTALKKGSRHGAPSPNIFLSEPEADD